MARSKARQLHGEHLSSVNNCKYEIKTAYQRKHKTLFYSRNNVNILHVLTLSNLQNTQGLLMQIKALNWCYLGLNIKVLMLKT